MSNDELPAEQKSMPEISDLIQAGVENRYKRVLAAARRARQVNEVRDEGAESQNAGKVILQAMREVVEGRVEIVEE